MLGYQGKSENIRVDQSVDPLGPSKITRKRFVVWGYNQMIAQDLFTRIVIRLITKFMGI